ncbi:hypothetical protein BD408DRAFT_447241 [Parasitella parasitica]|nr:hypothetical protein BD408DRAFT_447241 [Parasitella parasitica]
MPSKRSKSSECIALAELSVEDTKTREEIPLLAFAPVIKREDQKSSPYADREDCHADNTMLEFKLENRKPLAMMFKKSGREYFYQCHLCTELKTSLIELLDHHRCDHAYTNVCETTYPTPLLFKKHLRIVHFIVGKTARTLTTTPDPNDFCRVCNKSYLNRQQYFNHLFKFHGMRVSTKIRQLDVLPDLFDAGFDCRACERKLASKYSYAKHCKKIHKMDVSQLLYGPNSLYKTCGELFQDKTAL